MKTRIKAQIIMVLAIILLLTAVAPTIVRATEDKPLKTNKVLPFKKIIIKGNIEVVLIQKLNPGISYADDNEGNARVIQKGEILSIDGTSKVPAKLVVYVNDIFRIQAEENAIVKTQGMLSTKFLQVVLRGNAQADIYTKSEGLYTAIYDRSALQLKGSTDNHFLFRDKNPKLKIEDFAALNTQQAQP